MPRSNSISGNFDWLTFWLYTLLVGIGILSIFTVTYREGEDIVNEFVRMKGDYGKQTFFFLLSLFIGLGIMLTDSKFFTATANIWYVVGIVLLLLVFPFHTEVKGTQSIIRFGGFQFQPADICKVFVNLALAKYLSRVETDFSKPKSQMIAAAIVLAPAVLTILQKETGLAIVFFAFFLVMFREGLPSIYLIVGFSLAALVVATLLLDKNLLAGILTGLAVIAVILLRKQIKRKKSVLVKIVGIWMICVGIQFFFVPVLFTKILQPHQVTRIFSLIGRENPYIDASAQEDSSRPKDPDYNVRQSKIAIGSGGLTGKGFLKGTQTRLDFVPEQRTDFIFCTIGEGYGFIGSVLFLCLYLFLLLRLIHIAERQRSVFSRCYAYGLASVLFFHIAINVGMTIGLMPVIGIPLPFVSYGGTSLLTFSTMLFILLRLDADRHMILR